MSSFSFIRPQNTLYKDYKIAKTQTQILEKITNLPAETRNKHSMELLKLVCLCLEHSIDNKGKKDKMKICKKTLVIQIYTALFGNISPVDIDTISKNIEYLFDNGQIFKYSKWVIFSSSALSWVKSKL